MIDRKLTITVSVVDDDALGEIVRGINAATEPPYFQVRGYGVEILTAEEAAQ
jgi:hypothetical protein